MKRSVFRVLFHRDFRTFTGGHLKVWDYFNHVRHSPRHEPHIHFSKDTVWDETNPWISLKESIVPSWQSLHPDLFFLAGLDWLTLDAAQRRESPIPVINLIQGTRHARPDDRRYSFLKHRAVRICVSEEVQAALADTGQVNGPLFVIPACIQIGDLPAPLEDSAKPCDLLVVALKQPQLGRELTALLGRSGRQADILTAKLTRADFLQRINQAKVTLFLPTRSEGFYLPALEGMALGTCVVCPDCIGNRAFCIPDYNCFRPDYSAESILQAVDAAIRLPPLERGRMLLNARQTVATHHLMDERRAFLDLLDNIA